MTTATFSPRLSPYRRMENRPDMLSGPREAWKPEGRGWIRQMDMGEVLEKAIVRKELELVLSTGAARPGFEYVETRIKTKSGKTVTTHRYRKIKDSKPLTQKRPRETVSKPAMPKKQEQLLRHAKSWEDLQAKAARLLRDHETGRNMFHLQGGSTKMPDAVVYGYDKDGNVAIHANVPLGYLWSTREIHFAVAEAAARLAIKGYTPRTLLPEYMSGEPMRRTPEELEYDRSRSISNLWGPEQSGKSSGNMVIGD